MINETEERISALLDSELPTRDTEETLTRLGDDTGLRDCWDRYHLIGDLMRGEGVRPTAEGVAEAVRARVADEPPMIAAPRVPNTIRTQPAWLRPLTGAAIAASVAALAVYSVPRFSEEGVQNSAPLQVASAPVPINDYAPSGNRWRNLAPGVESKLNDYLVDHSEYASVGGMSGVLPYTTFVSYTAK